MAFGLSLTPVTLGGENIVTLDSGVDLTLIFRYNDFGDFYIVSVFEATELQFVTKVVEGEDMLLGKYGNKIIPSSDRMESNDTVVRFE